MTGEKPSFAAQAARFSFLAPIVCIILNVVMSPNLGDSRELRLGLGVLVAVLLVAGFLLAIYALLASRTRGAKGILGYAIAGLCLNGLVIASAVISFQGLKKISERHNVGLSAEEAGDIPRQFTGSTIVFDEEVGYRIEIPRGFVEVAGAERNPLFRYSFMNTAGDGTRLGIHLQHLGGRIGEENLASNDLDEMARSLPEGSEFTVFPVEWQGRTIDCIHHVMFAPEAKLAVFGVQVPLAREAVQINVGGTAENEDACRELLSQLLKSLHGESNWK